MTAAGASVDARETVGEVIEPGLRHAQPPTCFLSVPEDTFSGPEHTLLNPEPVEGPRDPVADEIHLIAHGSPDPSHATAVVAIAERLRRAAPDVTVSFLEHNRPRTSEALTPAHPNAARPAPRTTVVIPLLLTAGVHWHRDIPAVMGPAGQRSVLLAPPEPVHFAHAVAAAAARAAGHSHTPAPSIRRRVILASAGSTRPEVTARLSALAERVAAITGRGPGDVIVAERPEAVLTSARRNDVVVPVLIADGIFADRIRAAAGPLGADVTAVLGQTPEFATGLLNLVARAVQRR